MCGRFLNRRPIHETAGIFGTKNALPNWRPRYTLAPTDGPLAVRFNPETRKRSLDVLRWGLMPSANGGARDRIWLRRNLHGRRIRSSECESGECWLTCLRGPYGFADEVNR